MHLAWVRLGMVFGTAAIVVGGCVQIPGGLDSPEPAARIIAAAEAGGTRDPEAIGPLVEMLNSEDPAARLVASCSLERVLGRPIGFDPAAGEAARREAAAELARAYRAGELTPVDQETAR